MTSKTIATFDELEQALGGREPAREAFAATNSEYATWKHRGRIPPRYFNRHREILEKLGFEVLPDMWGQVPHATAPSEHPAI